MDSWSFNSAIIASDESFSNVDAFGKDQTGSMSWEVKPPFINGNNMGFLPNEVNMENTQMFGDSGFPPLMRNSLFNPVMAASKNTFSEENESNSRVDLKFGRLIDQTKAQSFKPSKNVHNLSPSEVSMPLKRPREGGFGSLTPFCKVHGCNKNLSNCKEYHKRHKVCEVHSKTTKVIVNGIEQRFCQQCSRFHLLREFDDGKRSCRKRLAGHNERRRKPQGSERNGRLLPSYNISIEGNEFKGSTGTILSFRIPSDHHSPYQQKYQTDGRWEMNLQDRMAHDYQSISSVTDERLNSNSFSPCNFKRNPIFDGYVNGFIESSTSGSSGLSGIASSSGSAHSLLSSQSQSTCHSSRIQASNSQSHSTLFLDSHYELSQDSGQMHLHDMNPMLGFEDSSVKFGIDGMFRVSKCMNSEDRVFQDEGCTIDLLQLSSQLERVEHQQRSSQVNGVSVGLGII